MPAQQGPQIPPELLQSTKQAVENAMVDAQVAAREYLSSHEEIIGAGVYRGEAASASLMTAVQVEQDLQKIVAGGQNLAHLLGFTATTWVEHEAETARAFARVIPD